MRTDSDGITKIYSIIFKIGSRIIRSESPIPDLVSREPVARESFPFADQANVSGYIGAGANIIN